MIYVPELGLGVEVAYGVPCIRMSCAFFWTLKPGRHSFVDEIFGHFFYLEVPGSDGGFAPLQRIVNERERGQDGHQ